MRVGWNARGAHVDDVEKDDVGETKTFHRDQSVSLYLDECFRGILDGRET